MAQTHSIDLESSSSQHLSIADNASLSITGDLTFESWVRFESTPSSGSAMGLIGKYGADAASRSYHWYLKNTAGTMSLALELTNSSSSETEKSVTWTPLTSVWYHLAVTYTASAGEIRFYVNGQQQGTTQTGAVTNIRDSTTDFWVGRSNIDGFYFDGLMKDVRVFDDVRTQTEIASDAGVQTVSNANLKAEWNLNNALTDSSGNSNTLTNNNSAVFSTTIPWEDAPDISGSTYLETNLVSYYTMANANDSKGSNNLTNNNTATFVTGKVGDAVDFESSSSQYLSIADASQTGLDGGTNYSFSFWINFETVGDPSNIIAKWTTATNNRQYLLSTATSEGTLKLITSADGTSGTNSTVTATWVPSTATWYHVVVSKNGTTVSFFIDGVQVGTDQTLSSSTIFNGTVQFTIGARGEPEGYVDGKMDEVAIYDRALHYGDVIDLYNAGSGITYLASSPSSSISSSISSSVSSSPSASVSSSPSTSISSSPSSSVSPSTSISSSVSPSSSVSTSPSSSISSSPSPSPSPSSSVSASPSPADWDYEVKHTSNYSFDNKNSSTYVFNNKNSTTWVFDNKNNI